jgi:hypothetical protein
MSFCVHNKVSVTCKICCPVYCYVCDTTLSKASIKSHYRSNKHIKNVYIPREKIVSNNVFICTECYIQYPESEYYHRKRLYSTYRYNVCKNCVKAERKIKYSLGRRGIVKL